MFADIKVKDHVSNNVFFYRRNSNGTEREYWMYIHPVEEIFYLNILTQD